MGWWVNPASNAWEDNGVGGSGVDPDPASPPPQAPADPAPAAAPGPYTWNVTRPSRLAGWTNTNPLWRSLNPYQKTAAMGLLEADAHPAHWLDNAQHVVGAIVNRAAMSGQDLGDHVSQRIYQPTFEWNQEARLPSIIRSPQFAALTNWTQQRAQGLQPDPVNGATHYLAHARVMLGLYYQNPSKYPISHWGQWAGFDPRIGDYRSKTFEDQSHSFIAADGSFSAPYYGPQQPQAHPLNDELGTIADNNPMMGAAVSSVGGDPSQLPDVSGSSSAPQNAPAPVAPATPTTFDPASWVDPSRSTVAQLDPSGDASAQDPAKAATKDANPKAVALAEYEDNQVNQVTKDAQAQIASRNGALPQFDDGTQSDTQPQDSQPAIATAAAETPAPSSQPAASASPPGMMSLGGPTNMADNFDWPPFQSVAPYKPTPIGNRASQIAQNAVITAQGGAPVISQTGGSGVAPAAGGAPVVGSGDPNLDAALAGGIKMNRAKMLAEQMDKMAYGPSASRTAFSPLEGLSRALAAGVGGYEGGQSDKQELAQREMMVRLLQGGGDPYKGITDYTMVANPEKAPEVASQMITARIQAQRMQLAAWIAAHPNEAPPANLLAPPGAQPAPAQAASAQPQPGAPPQIPSVPGVSVGGGAPMPTPNLPPPSAPAAGAPPGAPSAPAGAPPAAGAAPGVGPQLPFPGAPAGAPPGAPGPTTNSGQIPIPQVHRSPAAAAAYMLMPPDEEGKIMAEQEGQQGRQDQQIQATRSIEQTKLDTELVPVYTTGPGGMTIETRVQRSQVPAFIQANPSATTAGKPIMTPEQEAVSKSYGAEAEKLIAGREQAYGLNNTLTNMEGSLSNFTPGKTASFGYDAAGWLTAMGLDGFLPKGYKPENVASYQKFAKLATGYALDKARGLGAREAASVVQTVMGSNPNADMTPDSLRLIMSSMRAMNDYTIAKANAQEDWIQDPKNHGSLLGFSKQFQTEHAPETFMSQYLTDADREGPHALPLDVLKKIAGNSYKPAGAK